MIDATHSIASESQSQPLSIEDQARLRFDTIQRESRLAPELTCFQSGRPLSKIRFIANANSIHVAQWLKLLSYTESFVEIETANRSFAYENECFETRPLLPRWLKIPMVFRYLFSGLLLRFSPSRSTDELLHAHCASGNGFVAWLSGQRYLIGAYGSEIFGSNKRSFAYRWLLKRIVQKAERIQVASAECTKILIEEYGIDPDRIYCFHLGLDETIFHPVDDSHRHQLREAADLPLDEPIWIANRKTHPHYRTNEVVEGFLEHCQSGGRGHLVLLCGDHDPEYTKAISEAVVSHPQGSRIKIIDWMLSQKEVAKWLQLGDFAISVPKTDMLSVSTYQALGCGAIAVLSNLESYNPLRPCRPVVWMQEFAPQDFQAMFASTASTWPKPHDAHRKECLRFTKDRFSSENAIRDIAAFYLGNPLRNDGLAKWAA